MASSSPADPQRPSVRRLNASAKVLAGHPDDVISVLGRLAPDELSNVGEAVRQLQRERAVKRGDLDEIVADGFESGFGNDGLALPPWIEGDVVVCPGGMVAKSRTNHKCRFISVNDQWIWESTDLIREDKRSTPGPYDGFRAVGLLPVVTGMTLDLVSGKARQGMHSVDRVTSFEVRKRELVEISQRRISSTGMK